LAEVVSSCLNIMARIQESAKMGVTAEIEWGRELVTAADAVRYAADSLNNESFEEDALGVSREFLEALLEGNKILRSYFMFDQVITSQTGTQTPCHMNGFIITDMTTKERSVQELIDDTYEDTHNVTSPVILAVWLPVPERNTRQANGEMFETPIRTVSRDLLLSFGEEGESCTYTCFMEFQYRFGHMTAIVPSSGPFKLDSQQNKITSGGTLDWENPTRIDDSITSTSTPSEYQVQVPVAAFYVKTSHLAKFDTALNPTMKKVRLLSKHFCNLIGAFDEDRYSRFEDIDPLPRKGAVNILPFEVWNLIGDFEEDRYSRFEDIAPLPRKGADTFDYELPPDSPEKGTHPGDTKKSKRKKKTRKKAVRFGGGRYKNTCYQNVVLQLLDRVALIMNPDPDHLLPGPTVTLVGDSLLTTPDSSTSLDTPATTPSLGTPYSGPSLDNIVSEKSPVTTKKTARMQTSFPAPVMHSQNTIAPGN
jgi:hypothetical protein